MAVTLVSTPTVGGIKCFDVLDDGATIGAIGISQRERCGYSHGQVSFVRRFPDTARRGQFAKAYALAMDALELDVLQSDALMSKYAIHLWERIVAPPGLLKFKILVSEPLSSLEPAEHFSEFLGANYVCNPERRIWCLVRKGKEEYIALVFLEHPYWFEIVQGMHHLEDDC